MKTALGAFTAILLTGAIYMQPAHAQVYVQPGPGFSVQIGPGAPPPPPPQRNGAGARGITARAGKSGGEKDGGRENVNAAVGSQIPWSGMSALIACDRALGVRAP
jgi:hypothetical protein